MRRLALTLLLASTACGRSALEFRQPTDSPTSLRWQIVREGTPTTLDIGSAFAVFDGRLVAREVAPEGSRFVELVRGEDDWIETRRVAIAARTGTALAWNGQTVVAGTSGGSDGGIAVAIDDFMLPETVLRSVPHQGSFGRAVALRGDRLAVGQPGDLDGVVHLYTQERGAWSFLRAIRFPEAGFGAALAWLSDARLVVGAPAARAVVVVDLERDDVTIIAGPGNAVGFGSSLATDDTTLVVGAPYDGRDISNTPGAVYVYERVGTRWTLEQVLRRADPERDALFGTRVAVRGDRIVASAPNADEVVVYARRDAWTVTHSIASPDPGSRLGAQLALDADGVFIGAPNRGGVLYYVELGR